MTHLHLEIELSVELNIVTVNIKHRSQKIKERKTNQETLLIISGDIP